MTDETDAASPLRPPAVSRRSVVTAAAWSVPVIALAAQVPAYAASQPAQDTPPIYFADVQAGCHVEDPVFANWWGQPHRQELFVRHVNTTANFGAVKIDSILLDGQPLNLRYATSEPSGADLTPYAPWLLIPGQSWLKLVFSSTAPLSAGQLVINYHWGTTYPDVPFAASSPGPAAFTLDTCPPPYPAA